MRQTRAAAVFEETDPRSAGAARVVPPGAKLKKIGDAVIGYTMAGRESNLSDQRYSVVEMQGRHYRKIMRAIVRIRAKTGGAIDIALWTMVAAEVAAAIWGSSITEQSVRNLAAWVGFSPDEKSVGVVAVKAGGARRAPDFKLMPGATAGKLLGFTRAEEIIVAEWLGLQRLGILPMDDPDRRKRREAERKAAARLKQGALPRAMSKAALAREKGIPRWRLYHHARDENSEPASTDSSAFPFRRAMRTKVSMVPGKADESVDVSGGDITPKSIAMGNADESVDTGAKRQELATSKGDES